ncbi:MAG: deoxynucleoside kinase [Eubacteriales bacterium]|nr:deoxynucleoside kinase [Eubacteriales bacterium]
MDITVNGKTLIAFDGLDGSGKETQTKLLTEYLEKSGTPYRYLTFPTYHKDWSRLVTCYLNGDFGESPDSVNAYAASSFFAADRYCSYMLDWKKDYEEGKIILCNRYTTANAVHQLSKLDESLWEGFISWLYDYEFGRLGIPKPKLSIYLCVPPEIAQKHILSRSASDSRQMDIHEKSITHLEKSYKAALFSAEKLGWVTVNCVKDNEMRPVLDIHKEIITVVKDFVG